MAVRARASRSRPCSSQKIPRSFRSTRGRVAGQHAHGFIVESRIVEKEQNVLYNNGTQEKKNDKNRSRRTRKRICALDAGQYCTNVMRDKRGVVGDVARVIGGSLVAPPVDPIHIQ